MSFGDFTIIFIGAFVSVFLLGLQSKNVNQGRYLAAIVTSFGISVSQFIFVRYASSGDYAVLGVSATGGCLGIATAIWFHQTFLERLRKQ